MSNLASAQKIICLNPIPGADLIVTATVLGWQIVVKKDEFKVGDLVAYIQIDTVVPETEQFEFLRERAFRVRTIKLRKQISQGLIVPLPAGNWKEGDDLTDALGVKKYEKGGETPGVLPRKPKVWYKKWWYILKYTYLVKLFPNLNTFNRNRFPKHLVPITDEERIQNIPHVVEQYKGKEFVISEKLDGSSITIIRERKWNGKPKYRVCSRRFELFNDKNEWHQVFYSTKFADHMENLAAWFKTPHIIVQGEFIGKPQGNRYQLKENEIRLFNIYVDGKRVRQDVFYVACGELGIPCCPFLFQDSMEFGLPEILKFAEGKSTLHPNVEREGLVFRCIEDGLSFKVISNKYLLENKE
jgi:hypothetical protein